jgi:hypothetical protein
MEATATATSETDGERYKRKCQALKEKIKLLNVQVTIHKVEALRQAHLERACREDESRSEEELEVQTRIRSGGQLKEMGGRLVDSLNAIQERERKDNEDVLTLLNQLHEKDDRILSLLIEGKNSETAGDTKTKKAASVRVMAHEDIMAQVRENHAEALRIMSESLERERAKVEALHNLARSLERGMREEKVKLVELKYRLQRSRVPLAADLVALMEGNGQLRTSTAFAAAASRDCGVEPAGVWLRTGGKAEAEGQQEARGGARGLMPPNKRLTSVVAQSS